MSQYQRLSGYQLLLKRAQEHKNNPTSSEQRLFAALSQELPSLNFQFQVVMVPFIVDFVSLEKKVIIEVDGKSHDGNFDSDDTRQRDLERDGYSFLRFTHDQVMTSTSAVIAEIKRFCELPTSKRRKFASPKAEYVREGMTPRVIGEKNPFAGLHSRRELEIILSDQDPYELWETFESKNAESTKDEPNNICTCCNSPITPHESRIRDHNFEFPIRWVHKACRSIN